ncbi:MAG: hypothetical protein IJP66_04005 [Kiritimatiellae bacterium]|nr:hypothetical protein [Kiritimatiellia bacterium]
MRNAPAIFALCTAALEAFAATFACPPLSPPSHPDSETSACFAFSVPPAGVFSAMLDCPATPTNAISLLFGTDANEDGALDWSEARCKAGWESGAWEVVSLASGESIRIEPATPGQPRRLEVSVRTGGASGVVRTSALDNGAPLAMADGFAPLREIALCDTVVLAARGGADAASALALRALIDFTGLILK